MARPDGWIFWYNKRWYDYTGTTHPEMEGWGWRKVHHPDHVDRVVERVSRSWETGEPWEDTFPLRGRDGSWRWFLSRALPMHDADGRILRWFGTNTDITEHRETEAALRQETSRLEMLNRVGTVLAGELDLEHIVQVITDAGVTLSRAQFGAFFYNVTDDKGEHYTLYTLSGVPRETFERFPMPRNTKVFAPTFHGQGIVRSSDITKDPRYGQNGPYAGMPEGHLPVRSYLAVPVVSRAGKVLGGLFFGHSEAGVFTDGAERLLSGIAAQAAIAIDNARLVQSLQRELEERRRIEAHQKLLLDELNHRVKNTLTAVQSIAMQTLRTSSSAELFQESFSARLLALSKSHNLLARDQWKGAWLADLVSEALGPYRTESAAMSRVEVGGIRVRLAPTAAVTLGMAFHELATNAAKHGALSTPIGRVQVRWAMEQLDGTPAVAVLWAESGGPQPRPPSRRGFGSRLIERGVEQELGAKVDLRFLPEGLRCSLKIPLSLKVAVVE
jgi:PAS domain S-box-containing protein